MADNSWGVAPSGATRIRTNQTAEQRAADRMQAREMRVQERAAAAIRRAEDRVASRALEAKARDAAREERHLAGQQAVARDPHADGARRRRASGRKDVVREQRDTRQYRTIVDIDRMRILAARGASITGLAGAFGIAEHEVERLLADPASLLKE